MPPTVDNGYLSDPRDLESWREFIRHIAVALPAADPNIVFLSISPTDLANNATMDSFVSGNIIQNVHHWSTGIRMATNGWDPVTGGVVDYRTKVFNTTGLRACDCMILPEVSDGNLATPAVVIGATCADLIVEDFTTAPVKKKTTRNQFTPETYRQTAAKYNHQKNRKRVDVTLDLLNKMYPVPVSPPPGLFEIPANIRAMGLAAVQGRRFIGN